MADRAEFYVVSKKEAKLNFFLVVEWLKTKDTGKIRTCLSLYKAVLEEQAGRGQHKKITNVWV